MLLALLGIPVAWLALLASVAARRSRRGIGFSVVFVFQAAGSANWSITQSRSSTAGIGMLYLPFIGAIGGFLGLAFGRWRSSTDAGRSVGALAGLGGAVLLIAWNIREGTKTIATNEVREERQLAHSAQIDRDRAFIAAGLGQNEHRQGAYIDSSIRARINDPAFLIAALENDSVSPAILDTLATSDDLGIALQAVRNPNTSRATLRRVYLTHSNPNYFLQALAGHPNTPPEIIREIYTKPRTITGLDGWFARNPGTPRDVLEKIANTTTSTWALSQLLQNPELDCPLLEAAARTLEKTPSDSAATVVAQLDEHRPIVCSSS
jgi:hypothetical protein